MLVTPWGYTINDTLTELISAEEYEQFTAGKYRNDKRVEQNIKAVSMAIRNYCGWHVFPNLPCIMEATVYNRAVSVNGTEMLIQLPATFVSELTKVEIGGVAHDGYLETNGIVHIPGIYGTGTVRVEYTAGLSDVMASAVKELAAHRITHALASSEGVQSETAGGVSITYSANWINSARSTALADDNKEVLSPYRLQGVF